MAPNSFTLKQPSKQRQVGSLRWFVGMLMASTFSMVYFVAPFYMLTAAALLLAAPTSAFTWVYIMPILVSALVKPLPMPFVLRWLRPMVDYFDYEEIVESSPINVREEILLKGKNYLCVFQPHGALSFTGIVSAVTAEPAFQGTIVCDYRLK
jgi:hypothetical protein